MKEQDAYQLIDSYLNNELNAEDKIAVESRLQSDTEFAETFSMLEKVYGKIEDKGALNLVHRLKELNEQYPASEIDLTVDEAAAPPKKETVNVQMPKDVRAPEGTNNIMKWLFPILLIGAGGALLYYFMNKGVSETNTEVPKLEVPEQVPQENNIPKVETPTEKTIEDKTPIKKEVPEQKAPPKEEKVQKPKLYAAADFETNAMLDKMIGTTTRSELSFEVTAPTLNQNFSETTSSVSISGKTNSSETQKGTFRLLNNKRIDIFKQDISATGSFNFSAKVPKPGLYYYTLKLGSKTYVGKFTVGKK